MKNNYDNELYKKYEELIVEVRETNKKINDLKLENHTLDTELASMKNKINVELIVPAIKERYNVFIPINKTIGEVITILNKIINELDDSFPISNKLSIFDCIENKLYDINIEVYKTNIRNGSILALI